MLQLTVEPEPADTEDFGVWTGYSVPDDRTVWHPQVARLYDYWLTVKPPGRLPRRCDIVPENIAPLWSRLWLLDVVRGPLRYRYRFCGSDMVRLLGREITGHWLDEVHPNLMRNPQSRERFRFMAVTGCPTWRRGPPLWLHNDDYRMIETVIVPLAGDGATVDKMMAITVAFDMNGHEV